MTNPANNNSCARCISARNSVSQIVMIRTASAKSPCTKEKIAVSAVTAGLSQIDRGDCQLHRPIATIWPNQLAKGRIRTRLTVISNVPIVLIPCLIYPNSNAAADFDRFDLACR